MILQNNDTVAKLKREMFSAPMPAKTESYSPVSHRNVIEAVYEEAEKRGFQIGSEQYWSSKSGMQMTGKVNIVVPGNDELGMMIGFKNSYDKTIALGFAAGGNVLVCTNGMVTGDITLVRRHTGSIVEEIQSKIITSMEKLEEEFQTIVAQSQRMKSIEISKKDMAELAGRLFIEEELVNTTQLNILKKEIVASEAFPDETVWSMYNHVTEAFKKSHAYSYLNNHLDFHRFMAEEFDFA